MSRWIIMDPKDVDDRYRFNSIIIIYISVFFLLLISNTGFRVYS